MASSCEHIEKKISDEMLLQPLAYTGSEQFAGYLPQKEGGEALTSQLWGACVSGDVKTLKEILETNNISVNVQLDCRRTLLMIAAEHNQTRLVTFLLNQKGIDVSMMEQDHGTALSISLQIWSDFKNANYEIARQLIQAGADIDQVGLHENILFYTLRMRPLENALTLVMSLGASIQRTEPLFHTTPKNSQGCGHQDVPARIVLLKQKVTECLNHAKYLGAGVGCFNNIGNEKKAGAEGLQLLTKAVQSKIATFLYRNNPLATRAFHVGCAMMSKRLSRQFPTPGPTPAPIPRALLFMGDFEHRLKPIAHEISWQNWEREYNDKFPDREEQGYGPGAMVVYKL